MFDGVLNTSLLRLYKKNYYQNFTVTLLLTLDKFLIVRLLPYNVHNKNLNNSVHGHVALEKTLIHVTNH